MAWTPAHSRLALRNRRRGQQRDVGPGSAGIGPLRRRLEGVASLRRAGAVCPGCHRRPPRPVLIARQWRPGGSPRKPRALAARFSPARDIWISSGLRSGASGLRKFPLSGGWICLEFLGFSRPKWAFSMGYGRPGANFIFTRPFPGRTRRKGRPPSTRRPPAPSLLAGRKGSARGQSREWTSQGSDRALRPN